MQRVTGKSIPGPFLKRICAQSAIKLDGRCVPIEHCPLQPSIAPFHGDLRQSRQESFADSFTPMSRLYEKVFQIEAGLAEKRREVSKIESEASRLFVPICQQHLGHRIRAEDVFANVFFGGHYQMGKLLILRQLLNEAQDHRSVALCGCYDPQRLAQRKASTCART